LPDVADAVGLFGGAVAGYVAEFVTVVATDFILATTAAAASVWTVARPVIS